MTDLGDGRLLIPEEAADGEYAVAAAHAKGFDVVGRPKAIDQKRATREFSGAIREPPLEVVLKALGQASAGFIADGTSVVVAEPCDNPDPAASFGFIGVYVRVVSQASFAPGTLVARFDPSQLAGVARETLSLFRWSASSSSYERVGVSGVGTSGDFVWGRVTAPGIYAVLGLHAHPLALRTIGVLTTLAGLAEALTPEQSGTLLRGVCSLMLGSADLSDALNDPKVLDALRQESWALGLPDPIAAWKPNPGFDGGDLIDRCPALPSFRLPEGQLLPLHGRWPTPGGVGCADHGWESVGPVNLPGCMMQVVIDPGDNDRLYAAASDGGVWTLQSVISDRDLSWMPLTDDAPTLGTTAIAVAADDNQVIYRADGLGNLTRSDTAGRTWAAVGTGLGFIRKVLVDPTDSATVYLASDSGFWRSRDGGATWLGAGGVVGAPFCAGDATDAAMDPSDPSIIYVCVRRSGVLKTTGEDTWDVVLPWADGVVRPGTMIKIAVGHVGTDADRAVAVRFDQEVFVNLHGGRPPAVPGGGEWISRGVVSSPGDDPESGYGDWCHVIAIDPFDNDVMLTGAQQLFHTTDGGDTWTKVIGEYSDAHADQHAVAFDPTQRGVVYVANDGGVVRSTDSGATWELLHWGLVTGQLFPLGVHGSRAVTGMDHHGIQTTANVASHIWAGPGGGGWEFTRVYADPKRADIWYMAHGDLARYRWPSTTDQDFIEPFGTPTFAPMVGGDQVAPMAVDPRADSLSALVGTQAPGRLMRTLTVTDNEPVWAEVPGISLDTAGIAGVAFAPSTPGAAYAISEDGQVFYAPDANAPGAWTRTGQWATSGVVQITVNALHDERIYATTKHAIARSEDRGQNWIATAGTASDSLPNSPIRSLVAHPTDGRTLFAATEVGVFVSTTEGATWFSFNDGLPNALVAGLLWDSGYLYAATFGRGLWRRQVCL